MTLIRVVIVVYGISGRVVIAFVDGKTRCIREGHLEIYRHSESQFRSQSPSSLVKLIQDRISRLVVL